MRRNQLCRLRAYAAEPKEGSDTLPPFAVQLDGPATDPFAETSGLAFPFARENEFARSAGSGAQNRRKRHLIIPALFELAAPHRIGCDECRQPFGTCPLNHMLDPWNLRLCLTGGSMGLGKIWALLSPMGPETVKGVPHASGRRDIPGG